MSEPRFSPQQFLDEHAANMVGDKPYPELPFYKWLKEKEAVGSLPDRFSTALFSYYEGHAVRGAFTELELSNYEYIYRQVWWERHQREETRDRAAGGKAKAS